ncbi:NAD(P)/FAD-dependent oxidoreductase [Novosphingobium sp. TH158]|uniref:NAD(P)/FAD-dependent oxidoreductase n=1 Tax=Novosphingobium sp. TH158 TaxID=2067455 RepID=UPI000C7CF0F4|nr:FAD-dependent oxidoreductase [Novosphingobium sp. TH158]PLK26139.1 thioredoxin-disulfide reductase [Novosphingobium sp. TH158]
MARRLKNLEEVAVIGAGLAGLSAARQAARLGRMVTLFEASGLYGGLVATLGEVEDLPFPGTWSGQDLAMHLLEQSQKVGVRLIDAAVERLELGDRISLADANGATYAPDAVIVATGGSLRKLGVPGEEEFAGRGVSRCATCDGGFYRGKHVAVIGGGDGAVHEAMTLSRVAGQVTMVCRSPLKARREHIDKLDARDNVRFVWDSEVTAIHGDMKVTGLALRNLRSGEVSELACDGVFPFIGIDTANPLVAACAGGDPRIFLAGAARAGFGGTGIEAMAEGVSAAEAAHRFLSGSK